MCPTLSISSFPNVAFLTVPVSVWLTVALSRLVDRRTLSTPLLQAIDGVTSLALCPQVVSQCRQHFRSSETQTTCDGCFARQSICSVISLHSACLSVRSFPFTPACLVQSFGRWMSNIWHMPVWASHSTCHLLREAYRIWGWWHVWSDSHFETIQRRA